MSEGPRSPLEALGALASQEVEVTDGLRHVEIYTLGGLLTLLWHGDPEFEHVVLACGGAMGGLLGPADGLYHDLGVRLGGQGIGLVRVGYRKPNDLGACVQRVLSPLAPTTGGVKVAVPIRFELVQPRAAVPASSPAGR